MQFYLDGFRGGDPDIRDAIAAPLRPCPKRLMF
jgi:hypothetical protein